MRDIGLGPQCLGCLMEVAMVETAGLPSPGHRFGEYELHEELGRGGMGVVCRAWQPQLRRWVALKMLIGGVFAQPEFLERFRRESMAAARLKHPGIAVVHDVGERDGQAFYTMELLEGGSLADWIALGNPDWRAAAEMVEQTARAVAFAHQHGVLHRDLKPSNILLTPGGRTRVVDFGLALVVEETDEGGAHPTLTQSALGTPAYMAPEAAAGGRAGVAADIYSLGAVLYEMLTGQAPHQGQNAQAVLTRAREGAVLDPLRLNPRLPADLATICLKCLDREPGARYPGAEALADDLRRFLEGKPVLARPVGATGQVWRWARRNRLVAALAVGFLLSLLAGGIAVLRQASVNSRQKAALVLKESEADRLTAKLSAQLYAADLRSAWQEWEDGNPEGARRRLQEHGEDPQRGVEYHWLKRETARGGARELHRGVDYLSSISFSPEGRRLVAVNSSGVVKVGSAKEPSWRDTTLRVTSRAQFSAVTERLYYCRDGTLFHCGISADGTAMEETAGPPAAQFRIAPGGRWAALGASWSAFYRRSHGGTASLLDLSDHRIVWETPERHACSVAASGDGGRLATAGQAGGVILWDAPGRKELSRWDLPPVSTLNFSPDGRVLAAGGLDAAWLLEGAGKPPRRLPHPPGHHVVDVAFSTDGQHLATACTDRVVRVWPCDATRDPVTLHGHESEVWSVAWAPDGRSLVSAGRDGLVLQWEVSQFHHTDPAVPARFERPVFLPGSGGLLTSHGLYPDLTSARWHPDGTLEQSYPLNCHVIGAGADGSALLRNFSPNRLEWWPPGAAGPGRTLDFTGVSTRFACQISFPPDGRTLAVVDDAGLLTLRDDEGKGPARELQLYDVPARSGPLEIRTVAWSADSRFLAVGSNLPPFHIMLADCRTMAVTPLRGFRDTITGAAFSADGQWLASCSVDGSILVWSLSDLTAPAHRLPGHDRSAADLAFTPDSRSLLSLGPLDGVKFWHTATWRQLGTLRLPDAASHLAISPDSAWLAVTCGPAGKAERARIIPLR